MNVLCVCVCVCVIPRVVLHVNEHGWKTNNILTAQAEKNIFIYRFCSFIFLIPNEYKYVTENCYEHNTNVPENLQTIKYAKIVNELRRLGHYRVQKVKTVFAYVFLFEREAHRKYWISFALDACIIMMLKQKDEKQKKNKNNGIGNDRPMQKGEKRKKLRKYCRKRFRFCLLYEHVGLYT